MNLKDKLDIIFKELGERYGNSTTELHYGSPFQLLIAVVLSAQTTDKRVNVVTEELFKRYPDARAMSAASADDILPFIKTVNYANAKSRYLSSTAKKLAEWQELNHKDADQIPSTFDELTALQGVGTKTAKVILHTLFGEKVIAVDTHIHRVANRLGLVNTNAPLQTSKQLEKIVPEKYKSFAHHSILMFGRYHCTAISPICSTCPFQHICPYFQKVLKKTGKHR